MHESVSDSAGSSWYTVALVYAAGEPAHNLGLDRIVQKTFSTLAAAPAKICAVSVGGRVGRAQIFSSEKFASLAGELHSGALTISGLKGSRAHVDLHLYLRHNPAVALKYQPPGAIYFVVECGRGAVRAAREFLLACATEIPVLHGGIIASPNRNQALSTASLVGHDLSKEPESFVERWNYEAGKATSLWQKARRVYWVNLLGPALARQVGGIDAALKAAAAGVTEIAGSLIFEASEDIEDSLDPAIFSGKIRRIGEWLRPYLI